jgi:hypothetical protein
MSKQMFLSAVALAGVIVAGAASSATAMPVGGASAIGNAAPAQVEMVRWGGGYGRGGWGRGGWGWGVGAGLLGGAIIGGALAAPYYGYGPYYGPGPYYYGPGPYPAPAYGPGPGSGYGSGPGPGYGPGGPAGADAVASCARRYKSYDPSSGTFLGNDGQRHPCP